MFLKHLQKNLLLHKRATPESAVAAKTKKKKRAKANNKIAACCATQSTAAGTGERLRKKGYPAAQVCTSDLQHLRRAKTKKKTNHHTRKLLALLAPHPVPQQRHTKLPPVVHCSTLYLSAISAAADARLAHGSLASGFLCDWHLGVLIEKPDRPHLGFGTWPSLCAAPKCALVVS